MVRVGARMAGAVVAVLALTGCAAVTEPVPSPSTSPTASVLTATAEDAAVAAAEAEAVAVAAVTAFVNTQRDQETWWADFSQYLAPEALYIWEGVRADRVTASAIVGDPTTTVADATFVSVIIPTDVGSYRLDMAKRVDGTAQGTWLVFDMMAPAAAE